jgi:tetratricopeptide (TPR) repeat protein
MKKVLPLVVALFIIVTAYTQTAPVLKVADKELGLSSLDIQVDIVGNIATTTFDMLFYNPTNSVLEGELLFPLGEGHQVSRFALDINGKLREAVVVEKELGRIAFENVVRRGVDPALLEKGTGNNYKARIYPIPANGYKRVVVAYEQELIFGENAHTYFLPLHFKNKLNRFKLKITVFDQKYKPVIGKGDMPGLQFSNWNANYTTEVEKKNYRADTSLNIQIPLSETTEKIIIKDSYFYIYKTIKSPKKLRERPQSITLFWDASLSMKQRDLEKEITFLDYYFSTFKNLAVQLVVFSNTIQSDTEFRISNGDWSTLKKMLKKVIYDGGTNYKIIASYKNKADANLLFTDGIATLSESDIPSTSPFFIINTNVKSNHKALKIITEASDGSYINLQTTTPEEAIEKVKNQPYKFLGYETKVKNIEIYPVAPISIHNDFSLAGKNLRHKATIVLKFGYGNTVTKKIPIAIDPATATHRDVKRIWAQKKIGYLETDAQKNKTLIAHLGKAYSLVTDFTSLIVLDNVRDYIRYQITPPDELLDEYNRILAAQGESKKLQFTLGMKGNSRAPNSIQQDVVEEEVLEEIPSNNMRSTDIRANRLDETISEGHYEEGLPTQPSRTEVDEITDEIVLMEEVEDAGIEDISFSILEEVPIFPSCTGTKESIKMCFTESVKDHINTHFNKEVAAGTSLSGAQRIYLRFTINKRGNVIQIKARAPHRKLEEEAIRVARLLPKMTPGKQRGEPVSVKYIIPIVFNMGRNNQSAQNRRIELEEFSISATNAPEYKRYTGNLSVNDRKAITKYLTELRKATNKKEAYAIYLKQRAAYIEIPAYFIDVSNFFKDTFNANDEAYKIASNIAEIDFDNYELLKVFAYQLQQNHQNEQAAFIFKRILQLRPEDAQSYRDLGLAYEAAGKCQEALDLYNSILTGTIYEKNNHRRVFKSIKEIAKNELKHLIQTFKGDIDTGNVPKEFLKGTINYDIRVTIDWNHNDTDIDLHVIDPMLEECFYRHTTTKIGGKISEDMTQGFGPEEFTLKRAVKGTYYIKVNYYGDNYQKIENPTFMKITMYKHYGSKEETKEIKLIRLTTRGENEIVASLHF